MRKKLLKHKKISIRVYYTITDDNKIAIDEESMKYEFEEELEKIMDKFDGKDAK